MLATINPIVEAYHHSDVLGKLIFITLGILSVITWTLIIYKYLILKKIKKRFPSIEEAFFTHKTTPLHIELLDQSMTIYGSIVHPWIALYQAIKLQAIHLLKKNFHFIQAHVPTQKNSMLSNSDIEFLQVQLDNEMTVQVKKLEKYLFVLPMVISLAPFLGLLGTVWGILITFAHLNMKIGSNEAVFAGLSMALATTVLGLIVAIPALIAYSYLKNGTKEIMMHMQNFSNRVLAELTMQYRKVDLTL